MQYNIQGLGQWHQDVQLDSTTRISDIATPYMSGGFSNSEYIGNIFQRIYGDTFHTKTVLDVACNAGGNLFACQKAGLSAGYGFDARQSWIDQANWLKANVSLYDNSNLTFEVHTTDVIKDLPSFDVTLFNGIFYHLSNPQQVLAEVAAHTNEVIMINTAYDTAIDGQTPALIPKIESSDAGAKLSGVEGVSWHPNGEKILFMLLKQFGFVEFKVWFKKPPQNNSTIGRLCVLASKIPNLLK